MKRLLLAIALIFSFYITHAQTVDEFGFKELGYNDFYINDFEKSGCTKFEFAYPKDLNGYVFPIFTLKSDFPQDPKNMAKISVSLNGSKVKELKSGDFAVGVAHVWLPRQNFAKSNTLEVCAFTSATQNRIGVLADSFFGVYETAHFPESDGLTLELESYKPYVGRIFKIDSVARNYGSRDVEVELSYRQRDLEDKVSQLSILKGETSKKGVVPKCAERAKDTSCTRPGTLRITYYAVPQQAIEMSVLPSVMTFKNEFGEKDSIISNTPMIESVDYPEKVMARIFTEKDVAFANEPVQLKIKLKNTTAQEIKGITVELTGGLESQSGIIQAGSLQADESRDIEVVTKGGGQGNYQIGCIVRHGDENSSCRLSTIGLENKGIGAEVAVPILLALVAIGAFAYFYTRKTE